MTELRPIAAVDIGSNSIHLTLARVHADDRIEVLARVKDPARLAASIQPDRTLSPEGMTRAVDTLRRFRRLADEHGAELRATATAALRAARNGGEFVDRARVEAGVPVAIITGGEEARLTYQGVLHGLPDAVEERMLCVDVGGGSTELLVGQQGRATLVASVPVGSVVVSTRLLGADPVRRTAVRRARHRLDTLLSDRMRDVRRAGFGLAVATAGTIQRVVRVSRALRGLDLRRDLNGEVLTRQDLARVVETLEGCETQAERLRIPGIDPERADTLLAGALVFEALTRGLAIERWVVSSAALRTGLILDTQRRRYRSTSTG